MGTLSFRVRYVACAIAALGLIALAYWPGMAGPFLFDDFANLDSLGAFGPLDDWKTLLYYLTSGTADPTGRPLSLLSFLVDAQDWPADPWPFKRTNLVLHLVNTALVALVVARLQVALHRKTPLLAMSPWTPLLAAILWGAHPFLVSTTLYVVQREAMLPATFVLLAVLAWDRSVHAMRSGKVLPGWTWAVAGVGGCTLLAGLSKANGFLAPLLVGLVHLWCYRQKTGSGIRATDVLAALVLGLPSLLLVAYLVHHAVEIWSMPYLQGRDWTLPERLLSQPRALWDYMLRLALPRAGGGGLYVDDFVVSRGWHDPLTTLPAALALGASIAGAVAWRSRFPILTLAWVFFLGAHLLESSVLALEPYFEHRNYLPAMMLGWPVAHWLLRPASHVRARTALAVVLVLLLLVLTHQRASVWGDPALQTALSATNREDSVRSQVLDIHRRFLEGQVGPSMSSIHALQRESPDSVIVAVTAISLECAGTGNLSPDTLARSRNTLAVARNWNYGLYEWLANAAMSKWATTCEGFGFGGLHSLVDAGLDNPSNAGGSRRRDFLHVRGRIELAAGNPKAALDLFDAALALQPDPDYALVQAAALGNAGAQAMGVEHLDHYLRIERSSPIPVRDMRSLHRWLLVRCGYYRDELHALRTRLAADASQAHSLIRDQMQASGQMAYDQSRQSVPGPEQ